MYRNRGKILVFEVRKDESQTMKVLPSGFWFDYLGRNETEAMCHCLTDGRHYLVPVGTFRDKMVFMG